jgi:ubiquinone/menaquinone biosynthesis C-methylase UbiE
VSSLALMRWLEGTPARYDAGMRLVTLGRVTPLHEAVAAAAAPAPGARVLEIGCGTGAVTARLAARGARVLALDQNAAMIERARERLAGRGDEVELRECAAAEIDGLPAGAFDAVALSLALSEMSSSERVFVLRAAAARLRPGGVLVAADEVRPRSRLARALVGALRLPQAAAAWLLAGSLSHPLADLAGEVAGAGLRLRSERRWLLGSLAVLVAERVP